MINTNNIKKVLYKGGETLYEFNTQKEEFEVFNGESGGVVTKIIPFYSNIYKYKNYVYRYTVDKGILKEDYNKHKTREMINLETSISAQYQANNYYYAGTFSYMIKGSVDGTTTQWIKGNVLELNSLTIQYYDDEMICHKDDLVVIGDRIFCVEDTEAVQKRQPKPYYIYSSTLNSIIWGSICLEDILINFL